MFEDIRKMIERRLKPRINIPFCVTVCGLNESVGASQNNNTLENLSSGGCYLRLTRPLEPGTAFKTIAHLFPESSGEAVAQLALEGVVLRVEPLTNQTYGIALQLSNQKINNSRLKAGIPRIVEVFVALLSLIIVAPLLALLSILIRITSPGPIVFRQKRVGRNGKEFVLYKLRTMHISNKGPQVTATGDKRITNLGIVLRKTKLDELPELWNVLKGDMSLVGPRPEVPCYVDLDNPVWKLVLEARPGITDPVTLRLRNEETLLGQVPDDRESFYLQTLLPYKLKGYLRYGQERSWYSDLKVLCKTAVAVFMPGIVPPPSITEILRQGHSHCVNIENRAP